MTKKLVYAVDLAPGGAFSGIPPTVEIETDDTVNVGNVTVWMGGYKYPAHLLRAEEYDPIEEIRAGNNQRLNRIYGEEKSEGE